MRALFMFREAYGLRTSFSQQVAAEQLLLLIAEMTRDCVAIGVKYFAAKGDTWRDDIRERKQAKAVSRKYICVAG